MITFIFVYSTTSFRVDGEEPIKAFAANVSYADADVAIAAEDCGSLTRGVYCTCTESEVDPEISATSGSVTVDYDLATYQETDPLPTIIDVDPETVAPAVVALAGRVHDAF